MIKGRREAETESSDEDSVVETSHYNLLGLQQALVKHGPNRLHAVQELVALFKAVYGTRASKAVQQAMYNDAMAAVKLADRTRAFTNETSQLIKVVEKLLPQQNKKRQQLLTEHKRTCLALARTAKHHGDGADEEEEEDSAWCGPSMDGLPVEVARLILQHLDPVSLESMASCNRQWRALALSDELWQAWSLHCFPGAAAASAAKPSAPPPPSATPAHTQDRKWHDFFRIHLAGSPAWILELGAKRTLVDGRPQWRPPCTLRGLLEVQAAERGPRVQRAAAAMKLSRLMSVPMVVSWLLGKGVASSTSEDSSSDDSSEESCSGTGAASSSRVTSRLKLWSLPRV